MIRVPARFPRLILALALLTVFLLKLGRHLRLLRYDLEITSPSHRRRLSLFQTARRLPKRVFFNPLWQFA